MISLIAVKLMNIARYNIDNKPNQSFSMQIIIYQSKIEWQSVHE